MSSPGGAEGADGSKQNGVRGQADRGRYAQRPGDIPARGWLDVLWRVYREVTANHALLIAAGATYYLLLALFPALAAFVSLYGFVADPTTVAEQVAHLAGMLPSASLDLIRSQLQALARQDTDALGLGFIVSLLLALWSANNGVKALFEAMNIAYGETEKRSFIRLNAVSFLFTMGAIAIGMLLIASVGIVPAALALLRLEGWTETLIRVLRWPLLLLAISAAITLIYRYGPSRERAKWRWLTWGAVAATCVWLATSFAFSFYLENFADYNATYGALGAVIGFMVWIWISAIVLIVGAELNAELEHQTVKDTTTGPPLPMGERGAVMADTLGPSIGGSDDTPESQRVPATRPAAERCETVGETYMATTETETRLIASLASRHAISEDAVRAVLRALKASGGGMAQFSHPEFGGMSQWSGGMTMVGDMFNDGLKAKLDAIASELSAYVRANPASRSTAGFGDGTTRSGEGSPWWPAELGMPSAVGGQNSFRYAVFPERRRLAIDEDGDISIYDTGEHRISGISQAQAGSGSIRFSGPAGSVRLSEFRRVES